MSAPQFTPAPWHANKESGHIPIVFSSDGWAIADAKVYHGQWPRETSVANARLIAAAPELYEALDDVLVHCLADIEAEEQKDEPNEAALAIFRARRDRAVAALAKARGEQ